MASRWGSSFAVEQHQTGALHYSCMLGETVLEIYPGHAAQAPEANSGGATMIGLCVNDVDAASAAATAGGAKLRRAPSGDAAARRAVLEDPDATAWSSWRSLLLVD